jgi:GT2 family glycosyltransferase
MTVAAITITYNRLALTKQTVESFYFKTKIDHHVFVDNGSTDGTQEYIKQFHHIPLDKNYGISEAFAMAVKQLKGYDFILKLDNDIEVVTDNIIEKMLDFYERNGIEFVCSPIDLNLDINYAPPQIGKIGIQNLKGFNVTFTTHTGGAFQLIPYDICEQLCTNFTCLKKGDYMIGWFFREKGYKPTYLMDLQMRHIGLNQTSPNYIL